MFGVVLSAAVARAETIGRITQIAPHFRACFNVPPSIGRGVVTLRFSVRRDGSILAEPRVTHVSAPRDSETGRALLEAALKAVAACAPVPLTPSFGAAIAGRLFTIRFVVDGGGVSAIHRFEQPAGSPPPPVPALEPRRDPVAPPPPVTPRRAPIPPPVSRGQQDDVPIFIPQPPRPRPRSGD